MRRAPIVITATLIGTAGVLLFKPLPTSAVEGSSSDGTASESTSAGSGSASSGGTSSATSTPTSTPSATSKSAGTTVAGAVETDRYGNTQVEVTIRNGTITDVTVLQYNDDDPRSEQISQDAIPTLREEVLSKQTAAVDAVSGATYTSHAYEASLQAALDKAGFTAKDGSKADTDLSTADADLGGH